MLALIVAHHHSLYKSVKALLATVVDLDTLTTADLVEARQLMLTRRPDVIVVDGQLPVDQVLDLLAETVRVSPGAKRLLIIQAVEEQRAALELAGADLVALDGDPPERLADRLEQLLAEQRGRGQERS